LAEADTPDSEKPAVHLLDDGFQHRQLYRDVDILLLDSRDGRGSLLPAGNLREPLKAARRATVIAIPAKDDAPQLEAALRAWGFEGPIWRLRRAMEVPPVDGPVAAFCGIARPEQFFAGLEALGLQLVARYAFPDHQRYTPAGLESLAAEARDAGASALITTEKDQVRLGKLSTAFPEALPLKTASLHIEIEQEDEAIEWLVKRLTPPYGHPPL
jgi:tetraacyldisaccharide 4'-kinase